jgi:hypothetical protein
MVATRTGDCVAVVFNGAGSVSGFGCGVGAKEPSQDSGTTPKGVADKPAVPAKSTTPPYSRVAFSASGDARSTGAPTTRPAPPPRPLPAPSPL